MHVRPFTTMLAVTALAATVARGTELAAIAKPAYRTVSARTFTLDAPQEVRIEGTAYAARSTWTLARIWLLDATTRAVVWDVADATLARPRHDLARFDEKVRLGAGSYELYLATFPGEVGSWDRHGFDVDEMLSRLREAVDSRGMEDLVEKLEVRVTGEGAAGGDAAAGAIRERLARGAAVALVAAGDDADEQAGFQLREAADVRVVCHGEASRDTVYDGGWIEDADTGKTVWRFAARHAKPAGGAGKNQLADEVVHLAAGRYIAHYATDDEHSYPEFNSPPPDDPLAWGLVVRAARDTDAALFAPFAAEEAWRRNIIAEVTKVGDDERRSTGFTLRRPLAIRIVALGEGVDHEMVDYGWIVNLRTHDTVWEMDYDRTEYAGGAAKNRIANDVVKLPAGSYAVHYATDGSHAWGDWNSAPPFEQKRWGITVLAADGPPAAGDIAPFEAEAPVPALASITRVPSDKRREATFVMEHDGDVAVYALGESDGREMADYGWIEEAPGSRKVWEMRYTDTEPAGGSRKNRMFRGSIHLPAGAYRAVYVTDGSHAWDDWNSAPPRDPDSWGITVTLAAPLPAEAPPQP